MTTTSTTTFNTTTTPPAYTRSSPGSNAVLYNNQFIYSPSLQYATGMRNNQFGVYIAYGNGNVSSTSLWTASQSSTPSRAYFADQADRNLVVYSPSTAIWVTGTNSGTNSAAYSLQMLNSRNLIWTNSSNAIIWQTNTSG